MRTVIDIINVPGAATYPLLQLVSDIRHYPHTTLDGVYDMCSKPEHLVCFTPFKEAHRVLIKTKEVSGAKTLLDIRLMP